VRDQVVSALDGPLVRLVVDTLCVHGDTPGAGELAHGLRDALLAAGLTVRPPAPP
jgi:UPF0271 protein